MLYDAFICHASEDKDDFVRPLAERLRAHRLEVWYDEFSLKVGDSLRRSIDIGLAKSRYGIVVLSKSFLGKSWPQWELDGLVQRQHGGRESLILPIWHGVTHEEVLAFSPPLADKVAVPSDVGIDQVVGRLLATLRPEGSTLLIARDRLLDFDYEPPPVTDDWWLTVIEASASNPVEDTFQSASGWGRWGFPLPERGEKPSERGERLAWAAMQMMWQRAANSLRISQVTAPARVHDFIQSQPGLLEACQDYPHYLIAYAPQLSIRGFGGELEERIEFWYQNSLAECEKRRNAGNRSGSALTTDGGSPTCDEPFVFRHPDLGTYEPALIACQFVQGELMGPEVGFYPKIDYIAWLLSDQSRWLPEPIRNVLLEGMKDWNVWLWWEHDREAAEFGFRSDSTTGSLANAITRVTTYRRFSLTAESEEDIRARLEFSSSLLSLGESGIELARRFLDEEFVPRYFAANAKRATRRERSKRGYRGQKSIEPSGAPPQ